MKSTYAPLPFSYLSSDAKPQVGLRKDGVYGTSADVPRVYQPETQDQPRHDAAGNISMSTEYPYSVYANANALNQGTDYRGNNHQQPPQQTMPSKAPVDHQPYSRDGPQRFQEATQYRPQKPEGGILVYPPSKHEDPYGGRISPKELDLEPSSDYGYRGLGVAKRPQEPHRSNAVGRVTSYYPPVGNNAEKQVYEKFNGVESPSIPHTVEPKQKQPTAVMSKDFDNFILVKDPNRPESVVIPEPNNDQRRNNNLQTLFEAEEPRKQLPRYNAPPPENHYDSGPSKAESNTRQNQESGFDRSNYAIYHGPQQSGSEFVTATNPEPPNYRENKTGAGQPDSHRSSDARLVKDSSKGERNRTSGGCACGKCTAVVIAVIITAIICIGAGFVAGWFGAKAGGNDTSAGSSPSPAIFANLSTVTVGGKVLPTQPSAISSTTASTTSSSTQPSTISSTKASTTSSSTQPSAILSTTASTTSSSTQPSTISSTTASTTSSSTQPSAILATSATSTTEEPAANSTTVRSATTTTTTTVSRSGK